MNENYSRYYEDEMEIDLMDLFFHLLRHWRSLIAVVLLGAVLGAGVAVLRQEESDTVSEQEEREDLIENHIVEDDVRNYMELASEYRRLYAAELDYMQNSIVMQMDASSVARGELSIYLSAGTNTRRITEKYLSLVNDSQLLSEMLEAGQLDCEEKYLKEVFSASAGQEEQAQSSATTIQLLLDNGDNTLNQVITYTLSYPDEAACEQMMQVLRNYVEELDQTFRDTYEGYDFEVISDTVQMTVDSSYLTTQRTSMNAANTYLTNITNLEKNITDSDQQYYEVVYLSSIEEEESNEAAVPVESSLSKKTLLKWGIVGMAVLVICWGMYFCLAYIFSRSIKTADELNNTYGLPILGKISLDNSRVKGLDKWLLRLQKQRQAPFEKKDFVEDMLRSREENQVILCGNLEDAAVAEYLQDFGTECPNLEKSMFIHRDQQALVKAKESDGVILFVYAGRTARADVRRELEVCRMQGIPIMGSIVVI
jgi:hypothetical protein